MREAVDATDRFQPRFGMSGTLTVVVTDTDDGTLLMVAHMNAEALRLTLATGVAHFWSRSRQSLWKKGETSGETLMVTEMLTDCDQDALQIKVRPQGKGAACHTGRRSCFYRKVDGNKLVTVDDARLFDPAEVYRR
jgi:phosphoribosyl-AMP cyclohydrolase